MSTLKVNNLQVGQDATDTNNFTLYQPPSPNGTVRLGVGNVGSVTDVLTINSSGNIGIGVEPALNKFRVHKDLGTNDYISGAQHLSQFQIGRVSDNKSLEFAVLDNGTSVIQSKEIGVGYNNLVLQINGNVGIGVTNPSTYKLTVGGDISTSQVFRCTGFSDNATYQQIFGAEGQTGFYPAIAYRRSTNSGNRGFKFYTWDNLGNESKYLELSHNSHTFYNGSNASLLEINPSNGNLTVPYGNLVMGTAGKGIDFSATSNSSGTVSSEILSDYEEGSWTPVMKGIATAGSWSNGGVSGGFYIKVGRQVTCWANLNGTLSGASGEIRIVGLPFTRNASQTPSSIGNSPYSTGSIQYWSGISVQAMGPLIDHINEIYFHTYATNSSSGSPVGVVNGGHNLHFFVTFFVA